MIRTFSPQTTPLQQNPLQNIDKRNDLQIRMLYLSDTSDPVMDAVGVVLSNNVSSLLEKGTMMMMNMMIWMMTEM
jgi:hypothetical protein